MKKKLILIISLIVIIVMSLVYKNENEREILKKVQLITDYYLEKIELTDEDLEELDMNKDNEIDLFDAVLLLKENE